MFSIRKLMSVVKDVDSEAMPSSIFVNDDDNDVFQKKILESRYSTKRTVQGHSWSCKLLFHIKK